MSGLATALPSSFLAAVLDPPAHRARTDNPVRRESCRAAINRHMMPGYFAFGTANISGLALLP